MRGVPGAEEAVEAGGIPYWKARTGKEVDFLIGGAAPQTLSRPVMTWPTPRPWAGRSTLRRCAWMN